MNNNSYDIVVHVVNLILLGAIGILLFFSVVNISPAEDPIGDMFRVGHTVFLLVMWVVNYWFQYKKKRWILPIAGTILYVVIALLVMGVVSPFLRAMIESQF